MNSPKLQSTDELGADNGSNIELSEVYDNTTAAVEDAATAAHTFYTEWRQFALRKNVFDVTVGIMVGSALTNITTSLSKDIFYPLIISSWSGDNISDMFVVLKEGKAKCSNCYATLEEAQDDGAVTLNYGRFIDAVTSFLFTTLLLFLIYKGLMRLKADVEKATQEVIERQKVLAGTSK